MELPHVELHPDNGEHDDGEEEQQADLKQRHHGFHYGFQDNLETCGRQRHLDLSLKMICAMDLISVFRWTY